MPIHYTYGQPITPEEFARARDALLPDLTAQGKRQPVARLLAAMHALEPHRLEHEVNRARGLAYDSGEAGFSHHEVTQ